MLNIKAICAFIDNYIWAICDPEHARCIVVDPGDAQPVLDFLQKEQLALAGILLTHHHADHTGGVMQLKQQARCTDDFNVYGPHNPRIQGVDVKLTAGDALTLLGCHFAVLSVPGHTLDHIAYAGQSELTEVPFVFCGDTLFSVGCGRLFEGSPEQMVDSLAKLQKLDDKTAVYCTHEYTEANLRFALAVEPGNPAISRYQSWCEQQRAQNLPTLPSSIGHEKAVNPFLRATQPEIQNNLEKKYQVTIDDPVTSFALLRQWKDSF